MDSNRPSLTELQHHFSRLFGMRNAMFLNGLSMRIDMLGMSVSDLQDAIRRAPDPVVFQIAFARTVSRIFCITGHFGDDFPLARIMSEKYPAEGCGYCRAIPCTCGTHRQEHEALPPDPAQLNWTLRDWCVHINMMYGEKNRAKGIENTLNRLFREVEEVRSVYYCVPRKGWTPEQAIREFALEIADALAWTITCAYLLGVDPENAVLDRYKDGCTSCNTVPCSCGPFTLEQIDWEETLEKGRMAIRMGSHELSR